MKIIFYALLFLSLASCKKTSADGKNNDVVILDSIGFEDNTTGKWTVPYHQSITGYEPITGALSLYGYFSRSVTYALISPNFNFKKFVTVKFKYKMYTSDNLSNGRAIVSINGKEYAQQTLVHTNVQTFDQTFDVSPETQGKVTINILQDGETGKNIWIDDLVVSTKP